MRFENIKCYMDVHLSLFIQYLEESVFPSNVKNTILFINANGLMILNFLKHKTSKGNYD